jgi:hypothetical protein
MKILPYFSAKVGRHIFKLTIQNEKFHEISNDNGIRVVNFAMSAVLPHCNIQKYTWPSSAGKTQSD